ncbi:MAG TPA: regulatory protein RecX [Chitinophagaceae bacterium]|nr:regulatory protein RecX [Chitinophagaceae bacterium]
MLRQKKLSKEQAFQKLRHYCSYQERSHAEVKEKLYGFGLYKSDVESCIAELIENDYLNEERFATAFAGGKFRIKKWGKIKIRQGLKAKGVSDYSIKKAISLIPADDYEAALAKYARLKWSALNQEKNILIKKRKTQDHLLQKGFEADLIGKVLILLNK